MPVYVPATDQKDILRSQSTLIPKTFHPQNAKHMGLILRVYWQRGKSITAVPSAICSV